MSRHRTTGEIPPAVPVPPSKTVQPTITDTGSLAQSKGAYKAQISRALRKFLKNMTPEDNENLHKKYYSSIDKCDISVTARKEFNKFKEEMLEKVKGLTVNELEETLSAGGEQEEPESQEPTKIVTTHENPASSSGELYKTPQTTDEISNLRQQVIEVINTSIRPLKDDYKTLVITDPLSIDTKDLADTIDDSEVCKDILLDFIKIYTKTEYQDDMINVVKTILQHVKNGNYLDRETVYDRLARFKAINQIVPVERKSVKVTVAEKRPTYHELSLMSIGEYQRVRKEGILAFFRSRPNYILHQSKIQAVVDNEIERLKILKDEEAEYKKIQQQFDTGLVISLDSLHKLDPKVMYDEDYYLRVKQFEKMIKDLEQYGTQFLNEFLSYIEFHEEALKRYKADTDEMFTQLAFEVIAQHEIKENKKGDGNSGELTGRYWTCGACK